MEIIQLSKIYKSYKAGDITLPVLKGINLEVLSGEFISIMGSSGSGKTTLLNIIGCLDTFDSGEYLLRSEISISNTSTNALAQIRRENMGFVFQQFNLIPRFSAARNIELPLIYKGVNKRKRKILVDSALARVDLKKRANHTPSQLSGGQQQRIAIARALVNKPDIIVADEPTGSLDTPTGIEIMKLFQSLNSEGVTIIMVTHEEDVANFSNRIIYLQDGRVINQNKLKIRT